MNPFSAPKDYSEMLNKIFVYTFFGSLFFTFLISSSSPTILAILNKSAIKVDVPGIKEVSIAYAIVPLIVALFTRVVKLHDKISDLFKIREAFDIQEILVPLTGGAGIPVTLLTIDKFKKQRDEIMAQVFYKYASSTKPVIDSHHIIMALDKWSWFWILIELIFVGFVSLIILLVIGAFQKAAWTATGIFAGTLLASFTQRICASAAHTQIKEILSDPDRKAEIRTFLSAL